MKSLETSGLRYWDIYYIHTTNAFDNHPILQTYNKLLELKEEKLCLNVGLSNITFEQLEAILINSTKPDYIQIEIHPYLVEERIVNFCKNNAIKIVAHSPFGSSLWKEIADDAILLELAKKYNVTVAQLVLNWHVSRGIIPIPSSNDKNHMGSNLKRIDISSADVHIINALNKNKRVWVKPNHYETIGKICEPLPKRKIVMEDLIQDDSVYSSIINDIVLKGFYIGSTNIDSQLHSLCNELQLEGKPNKEILEKIQNNPFLISILSTYQTNTFLASTFSRYQKNHKFLNCIIRKNIPHANLRPYFTELFHRDTQCQKTLKVIIYLSDVGEENGPFQIIYPEPDVNLKWYKDKINARTPPEEIVQNIPQENIISIKGPAYTMIIFEGTALHCGGFVKRGFREIVYID